MARASNLTMCSFCGKSHSEVKKLIAGPGVYICNECIDVCSTILRKELAGGDGDSSGGSTATRPAALRAQLREARDDARVAAVVLRIDSAGGDALASEAIWREVHLLREAGKPVVASLGSYAASGGCGTAGALRG